MFVLGLGTSFHCVGMCGPLVLTYAVKGSEGGTFWNRMKPHFAYQGAKILSYMLVGALLGLIGSFFDLAGFRNWVTLVAGVFMVVLGLQMTGWVPALRRFQLRPPKFLISWASTLRRRSNTEMIEEGHVSLATPILFGLMTGLMPCAPLQGAQLAAAATGSPVNGAFAMFAFGLGTMPLMLGFGAVSGMLTAQFKQRVMVALAIMVMVLGLFMVNRGLMLTGSPVNFQTAINAVTGTGSGNGAASFKKGADGVVEVPLVIENTQFVPQTVSVPADQKVRLVVDRREANACSDQIALPQLGVLQNLKANGVTAVELPPTKAGTYNLTCGMGMMSGTLAVGAGVGGGPNWLVIGLGLLVVALVAWWLFGRRRAQPAGAGAQGEPAAKPMLSATEIVLVVAAVAIAVVAGLMLGGMPR
jgi:sulfite exporter TauE/SafE